VLGGAITINYFKSSIDVDNLTYGWHHIALGNAITGSVPSGSGDTDIWIYQSPIITGNQSIQIWIDRVVNKVCFRNNYGNWMAWKSVTLNSLA
jgi:hypothetical protein